MTMKNIFGLLKISVLLIMTTISCVRNTGDEPVLPAQEIFKALKEQDIYVRYWNKDRISNHLRISIGTDEEMQEFIRRIKNEFFV